jgi:TetR/AcrR family transcriptional repressor of bet genes
VPKLVDHDTRRGEIAAAVFRLVARDGLEALTVRDVASEAGWSTGVLAHYFRDKDELLAFAFERVAERVRRRVDALPPARDPLERLRAALLELVPLDDERRAECQIWFGFLGRALARAELATIQEALYAEWRGRLERALAEAQEAGAVRAGVRPADEAAELAALVDGLSLQALFAPGTLDAARLSRLVEARVDQLRL